MARTRLHDEAPDAAQPQPEPEEKKRGGRPSAAGSSGLRPHRNGKKYGTREEWLVAAARKVAGQFKSIDKPLPDNFRVTCGFPLGARTAKAIGEAWHKRCSMDGTWEVMISPVLAEAERVADVLVHELIHLAVGFDCGHKGDFKDAAQKLGLVAPWTATTAGPEFKKWAGPLVAALGPYPHAALVALGEDGRQDPSGGGRLDPKGRPSTGPKKQKTHLMKCECPGCGYLARITAVWLREKGAPICPECQIQFKHDPLPEEPGQEEPGEGE